MALRKTLFFVCQVVAMLCLVARYVIAGQWIEVVVVTLTAPVWLLARKYPASWLPSICLLVSVGLAVMGMLTGSSALLMICGSGFSLVAWDLASLEAALGSDPAGEQTRRYENRHLQSLALALGSGMLAAFLGRLVHLQLPFLLLILFVALAIFGLDRVWGYIKK